MTSSDRDPIAVVGATGQQGGSAIDALLDDGAPVRALVRDPSCAAGASIWSPPTRRTAIHWREGWRGCPRSSS